MKKLLPGILALLMAFGCMTACGQTPDASTPDGSTPPASTPGDNSTPGDSTPEEPKHQHETDLADVKDYLLEQISKKDLSTYKDFTLPTSFSFIGETTKYAITWTSNVTDVTIEAGETEATVKIGKVNEDTAFVLTATVTDPDGCHTTTFTVDGVAEREPQIVPNAISAKPVENTQYKLHMYQVTKAQDLYFTGKMSGFYFATTNASNGQTYADGVDLYVEYIADSDAFNVYFMDANNVKQYIGVQEGWNSKNNYWTFNVVFAETAPSSFVWSDEYGTIITTVPCRSSANNKDQNAVQDSTETVYLGTSGTYMTFSAMLLSKINTTADACVGKLVEMVDKSTIVVPASKKVADVKASLSIGTQYTLDKEIELTVADERYDDVTITWAVEGAGATIADGKLSLTIPAEKATVTLTATIACGETTDTKEFTLELGPKTVVPEDKTDAAAIVAAAYNLAAGETLPGGTYTLTGEITKVNTAWDAGYSNITVTITVGDKTFECYRLKSGDADASVLKVGDTITVSGTIKNYNGKVEFDAGCILDAVVAGETPDVPDEPVVESGAVLPEVGKAYAFGMTQANCDNKVYYLAGGMDGFYMATTDDISKAIPTYIETTEGGYFFYTYVNEVKTYINMVVSGTHVNGAYEATASTVYTIDETNKTLVALVNEAYYWYGTRNDKNYTTMGPCAVSYAGFFAQFYAIEGAEEPDTPDTPVEPEEPDVPVATENKADFGTFNSDGFGQYTQTFTTANGWTTVNSALQVGGPSVANPAYPVIGADKTFKAVCLNGKTSAPGKLTSPTLKGGISVLNLTYTKMFTDTKLGVKITVTDLATGATQETTISRDVDKDNDKYVVWTYEWTLETAITGDFTIEVVNACPSALDSNKDRMTILELSWIATAGGETPDTPDTPVEPEEPETPDVPEIQTLTIAEAIAKAAEQGAGKYTTEMFYITGKITEVQNSTYGNVMISDGTNEILVYGMYMNNNGSKGDRYDAMAKKPVAGDTVKLLSVVGMYGTTKQLKDALLVEITDATDAEKVAIEKDALTLTDAVTGATSIALAANGASRAEVAISWEVTAGNEIATIANGKLEITNPTAQTTVTVKATITCGESVDSKTFDIVVSVLEAGEAAVIVADFNTLNSSSSYGSATTTNGWKVVNAAIQKNGTANSGDSFAIVPADTKAVCLNGKTTAVGKLTSPTITTGVSKISFNYAYFFSEANGVNITISVKDASGNIVTSHNMTMPSSAIAKLTAYSYEWVLGTAVTEDCTIEVVNNSPSKNTGNKDRLSIWNFTVTGVAS